MEPVPQRVMITDVNIPFGSMVPSIFKWTFASIPTVIVVIAIVALLEALAGGIIAGLVRH